MNKRVLDKMNDALAAEMQKLFTNGHLEAAESIVAKYFLHPKDRARHFRLAIDSKVCTASGKVIRRIPLAELATVATGYGSEAKKIVELSAQLKHGELSISDFKRRLRHLKPKTKISVAFALMTHLSALISGACPNCGGSGVKFKRSASGRSPVAP